MAVVSETSFFAAVLERAHLSKPGNWCWHKPLGSEPNPVVCVGARKVMLLPQRSTSLGGSSPCWSALEQLLLSREVNTGEIHARPNGDCSVAGLWFGGFCVFSGYRSYLPPVLQGCTLHTKNRKEITRDWLRLSAPTMVRKCLFLSAVSFN